MTEKYSLWPINPQQLTPVQTALQRLSEKHHDFEIQAVTTIRPPNIEYTKTSQPLVPVDTPLSVIRKHIPRQSDIDKIVKSIETMQMLTHRWYLLTKLHKHKLWKRTRSKRWLLYHILLLQQDSTGCHYRKI